MSLCDIQLEPSLRSPEDFVLYTTVCGPGRVYITAEFGPLAEKRHAIKGTVLAVLDAGRYSISYSELPAAARAVAAEAVDALAYAAELENHETSRKIELKLYRIAVEAYALNPSAVWGKPSSDSSMSADCRPYLLSRTPGGCTLVGTATAYGAEATFKFASAFGFMGRRRVKRIRRRLDEHSPRLSNYLTYKESSLIYHLFEVYLTVPLVTDGLRELFAKLSELGVLLAAPTGGKP